MATDQKVWFLGPLDRIIYLNTLPALEGLAPSHLAAISQHARERFFGRGSLLLDPAEPAQAFHIVVDGKVVVNRPGRPSQNIGPREAVGFLHLLARDRTGLEARALVDTVTLELDNDVQLAICQEDFPILRQYLRYLCFQSIQERQRLEGENSTSSADLGNDPQPPLDLIQRLLALQKFTAFSGTDLDALAELARQVKEVRLQTGERVWEIGESSDFFLFPVHGSLSCHPGSTHQSWQSSSGQTAGLEETLARVPRWYQATASDPLLAMQLADDAFIDILEDHFEMTIDLVATLAQQLIDLQEARASLVPPK